MSYQGLWVSTVYLLFSQAAFSATDPQPLNCPDFIAVIEGEEISQRVLKRMEPIYRQLGCETQFIEMPGQRALVGFNQGVVDGELVRIESAASEYQRPFSRSSVAVVEVHSALFVHPQQRTQPIGYQLGVIWQKRYASQLDNTLQMYSAAELCDAYNLGNISGFLSNYVSVDELVNRKRLSPMPVIDKKLPSYPLYHYLGAEYEPLMQRISQLLVQSGSQ
ncbi:MAG: hypothetical protein V7707_12140 [Motiliproteus sp.]